MIDQSGPANANLESALRDAVNAIDALLAGGHCVVVHCHGGRSRTGLVLKAWAMRTHGFTEREAHQWPSERWSCCEDCQEPFVALLQEQ